MERKQSPQRSDADHSTESGRISRSGTESGISIGSESTSGGQDPIEPGEHVQPSTDKAPPSPRRGQR